MMQNLYVARLEFLPSGSPMLQDLEEETAEEASKYGKLQKRRPRRFFPSEATMSCFDGIH